MGVEWKSRQPAKRAKEMSRTPSMVENKVMVVLGLLLLITAFLAKGFGTGLFSRRQPYRATLGLMITLFVFGLLMLILGIVRLTHH